MLQDKVEYLRVQVQKWTGGKKNGEVSVSFVLDTH